MQTHIVYQPKLAGEDRVVQKLRDEHAFVKAQHLLDEEVTQRVFLRTEGSNILWLMVKIENRYQMAGTLIRKRGTTTKIPVKVID